MRTRAGHFYKITRIDENGLIYWNKIQCGWSMEQLKDIVVKHSKNIIDLVEEGDYVNGRRVIYVDTIEDENDNEKLCVFVEETQDCIEENEIETIVTHEQFANVEYKVEEGK